MFFSLLHTSQGGESFALKKSKVSALSSRFLVLVLLQLSCIILPIPFQNEPAELASQATKEKDGPGAAAASGHSESVAAAVLTRARGMGDAAVNHPVVAAGGGDVGNSSPATAGGGFVALDVGALSSLAGDAGPPGTPTAPPRTPKVMRSLSRKGDRKPAPADADSNGTAGGGSERPQLFVHVAAGDLGDAPGSARLVVHTPLAGTPGSKSRRFGRRPAPWLDPRRVVFLFATLSSVGTLILLYFTLSMSRADTRSGGASDAR